ncbi:uncharacterized protein LOC9314796 isoform X1 [Arabidopsis lyrata subsp. lyrata]|uniref:uncharacterized protein LOC9314796 isoform X1 n=1 Tax=Arabidopsis lyrata subsp. lyrata TaxID=81972 RepID=UPI000A29E23D|nr:uncharacterized protein LOC9314796 isoform X1 [Arabidopsis lyrata subsp. lyrata]|eukprot:XP_020883592.1 uncharacterized protein LOC9314796 isoform X1 [Arabidopsis lyrata subsp. lyrata]
MLRDVHVAPFFFLSFSFSLKSRKQRQFRKLMRAPIGISSGTENYSDYADSDEDDADADYEFVEDAADDSDDLIFCRRQAIRCKAFTHMEGEIEFVQIDPNDLYPCLLMNVGSGVSIIKVDGERKV